jgi:tetratricopeptide (TPR) repeat protein
MTRAAAWLLLVATTACVGTAPPAVPMRDELVPGPEPSVVAGSALHAIAQLVQVGAHHEAALRAAQYADLVFAGVAVVQPDTVVAAQAVATVASDGSAWLPWLHAATQQRNTPWSPCPPVARVHAAFAAAATGTTPAGLAATVLGAADELAGTSPGAAAQLRLVAHTLAPDAATWLQAVQALATEVAAVPGAARPLAWTRAVATRPADAVWPAEVAAAVRRRCVAPDLPIAETERLLWLLVGEQHAARGEALPGLRAFRQVEGGGVAWLQLRARLGQARMLQALGQSGDARAVLAALVADADPAVQAPALALLGAIELGADRVAVARALLERAIAGPLAEADRAGALANLGLALAMAGDEVAARAWLHRAQEAFAAGGDGLGLLQCLDNEIELLAGASGGAADAVRAARARVAASGPAALQAGPAP